MEGTKRINIQEGILVKIVLKQDQRTGQLTEGVVDKILTNSPTHHHGIKVKLEGGQVGRVKEINEDEQKRHKIIRKERTIQKRKSQICCC